MTMPIFGYSGVGKSTYANEFPAVAKDMQQQPGQTLEQFMLEVGVQIQSKGYRYLFLPCDLPIKQEFLKRRIAYVVVLPGGKLSDWVRRWVKASDSADIIKWRVDRYKQSLLDFAADPIIYIDGATNEWIGNVLSQYGNADAKKEEQ